MHLLKLLKCPIRSFTLKRIFQEPQYFQNKKFHARMQLTRGWMLYEYA